MANDPHTQLLILALLLYPPLKQASTSVAALRRLREMTADDLAHLVRAGFPKVNVTLDNGSIDHGLRMIRDRRDRDSRLDHFISHGATTALLRQLFRLPVAEIKARRAALLGEHRQRRPQMPPPRERDAIHAAWWALRGGNASHAPSIEQYVGLHDRFPHMTYATLFAVINEFEDTSP